MVTISKENSVVTLVNVFTVEPEDQQKLVDMLVGATEKTMKNIPGFVSANIHKSLDGKRVVNYAQWRSAEDFEAMVKAPEAQEHMKPIMEIAKADFHLYEVIDSFELSQFLFFENAFARNAPPFYENDIMDKDLNQMTREELIAEVKKLRQGIRNHRDSNRHKLCWHHPSLWRLLPEKTDPLPVVPEWSEFMQGCVKYRQSLDEQAPNAPRTREPYEK